MSSNIPVFSNINTRPASMEFLTSLLRDTTSDEELLARIHSIAIRHLSTLPQVTDTDLQSFLNSALENPLIPTNSSQCASPTPSCVSLPPEQFLEESKEQSFSLESLPPPPSQIHSTSNQSARALASKIPTSKQKPSRRYQPYTKATDKKSEPPLSIEKGPPAEEVPELRPIAKVTKRRHTWTATQDRALCEILAQNPSLPWQDVAKRLVLPDDITEFSVRDRFTRILGSIITTSGHYLEGTTAEEKKNSLAKITTQGEGFTILYNPKQGQSYPEKWNETIDCELWKLHQEGLSARKIAQKLNETFENGDPVYTKDACYHRLKSLGV
ncbi:MAG: hypothetical protein FJZ63_02510 [Chlamydiae bacterium]|nr:hypothetical protein [Chlamydiota bacterium]